MKAFGAADLGEEPRLEIGSVGEPGQLVAVREFPAVGEQRGVPDGFLDVANQVEQNVLVLQAETGGGQRLSGSLLNKVMVPPRR